MTILLGVVAVIAAIIFFTLVKLWAPEDPNKLLVINLVYFALVISVTAYVMRGPMSIVIILGLVVLLILMQAGIQDLAAFVVIYLTKMYGVGDIIRVKEYSGQVVSIRPMTTLLENNFTGVRVELPNKMVLSSYKHI